MIWLSLLSGVSSRRRADVTGAALLEAERFRQAWMLDDYKVRGEVSRSGPDVFCYTLDGRISNFEGFEGQERGTRIIIEGSDRRSYEAAARSARLNKYDIIVADCLVRNSQQPFLNYLLQNVVCGEVVRRMCRTYRPRERSTVVSVVDANDDLLRTLDNTYGNYGLDFVVGSREFGPDMDKDILDVGLSRRAFFRA